MGSVLAWMALLIVCGVGWRLLTPGGVAADAMRRALTTLVYHLLLPALVLTTLWSAPLGSDALRVAGSAAIGVLAMLGLFLLLARWLPFPRPALGAAILAAACPNATYMGLPVLETTLGSWTRSVVIQYDLFACTPLLLTIGVLIASRFGESDERPTLLHTLLRIPPLWAALAGAILSLAGVPQPAVLAGGLEMLAMAVIPLMLLALGMGLRWPGLKASHPGLLLPVVLAQLLLMPLVVWSAARGFGLSGEMLIAVALEGAMPSMVLGLVLCDRYRLNTTFYAMAVTLSTALSLVTLPLWFALLQ